MTSELRLQCIYHCFVSIDRTTSVEQILDLLDYCIKKLGHRGSFISGIPLPNQSLDSLVLVNSWITEKLSFLPTADDLVFNKSTDWPIAFVLKQQFHCHSEFAKSLKGHYDDFEILIAPISAVKCYQGVAVCHFSRAEIAHSEEDQVISFQERILFTTLVNSAFVKIANIKPNLFHRSGELTSREKDVLSVSSLGYTSLEVAEILNIRERTVVTHIQNASQKLGARNRVECVLHGIRFQQIGPGAGLGFYQIENEVFDCPTPC